MPLPANSRLGPYEIKSPLGAGGMGEVYRARDSRLNRDVAIKVLRSDANATSELKSRFEREARAVAALNHPNIVSVFDFGIDNLDGGESQYIVSELIEGESLRQVIAGKPVPTRRLVDIAVQIADGLAAAHAAGIVHRDLKPENILVTKDGRAKILDFGLARQNTKTVPANSSDETFAPETKENLTSAGSILGTASYMSPEQAVGKEIDYRSDQFSFGLILHEMATGKQAFARNSSVETMAAIVRDEPPPIEQKLPAPLKWIIDRCLHKEPEQRYESTRDLYREFRNLREHFSDAYSSSGLLAPIPARARQIRWKHLAGSAISALLIGAVITYWLKPFGPDLANYRYTPFANDAFSQIWSPDGNAVAYSTSVNGIYQLFLRYLNSPVPLQLTHEKQNVWAQGWSSDRNHIVVLENNEKGLQLYSVPIVGGKPEFIMDSQCFNGCDLSRDGRAWAEFTRDPNGYYQVAISDPIGTPMRFYAPAPFSGRERYGESYLAFSSDGKKVLLSYGGEKGNSQFWILPLPAGSGTPRRILPNLGDIPTFSSMPDSRHFVLAAINDETSAVHLWMADIDSDKLVPLTTGAANEYNPLASPDGKIIIYSQKNVQVDAISLSLVDGSAKTLVSTGRVETSPTWAAKQGKLIWVSNRSGSYQIWTRMPDGSERPIVTPADFPSGTTGNFMTPSPSPDGERLIFDRGESTAEGREQLWLSSLSGGAAVRLTSENESMEYGGAWSPDGTRFAYHRILAGKTSLMVVKASGNALPAVLKEDILAFLSDWSPSGEWITYRDPKGWNLISSDGKNSKFLGAIPTDALTFSRDGKLLYGIRTGTNNVNGSQQTNLLLFSLDPLTLKQKVIKDLSRDFAPTTLNWPSARFSLSPDGQSIAYSTEKSQNDLWMLTGYRQPGLWNQITSPFASSK